MNKKKDVGKRPDTAIIVAIIALVGTLITALLSSPVIVALITRTPVPTSTETPNLSSTAQNLPTSITDVPTITIQQSSSGKIAFSSTKDNVRGLYLLDVQDKSILPIAPKLTENLNAYFHFKWSPNGKKILYSGFLPQDGLYIFDVESNKSELLIDKSAFSFNWSPSNDQIIFSTNQTTSNGIYSFGQYILDLNTKDYQLLSNFPPEVSGMTDSVAWSPDNTTIAFSAWTEDSLDIFFINPNGSNLQNMTAPAKNSGDKTVFYDLAWSPDSKYLAIMTDNSIMLMSKDKSIKVLFNQEKGFSPDQDRLSWSPDSSKIIFDDVYDIIRIISIADGAITTLPLNGTCPNWSPDGENIVFASPGLNGNEVYITNDNGTERLTDGLQVECAVWQP